MIVEGRTTKRAAPETCAPLIRRPGEVLIDEATHELVRGAVLVQAVEPLSRGSPSGRS